MSCLFVKGADNVYTGVCVYDMLRAACCVLKFCLCAFHGEGREDAKAKEGSKRGRRREGGRNGGKEGGEEMGRGG